MTESLPLPEPTLDDLLRTAGDMTRAAKERVDACWELSRRCGKRPYRGTTPLFRRLLRDNDPEVAEAAAFALGRIGARSALEPLVRLLKESPHAAVRYAAAMSLRDLHDERAIEPLFETLQNAREDARVRGQAAEAFGCICLWTDVHTSRLLPLLRDPEAEVRFWVAYALSQLGDPAAVPALQEIANDERVLPHWRSVGDEAQWAIATIQEELTGWRRHLSPDLVPWVPVRYRDFETMTPEQDYGLAAGRIRRAAEALRERGLDVLLVTPGADMTYLTGFAHGHAGERLLAFVLRADGSFAWISPAMNVGQIDSHGLGGGEVRGWTDAETYLPALREYVGSAAAIAFDDEARSAFLMDLRDVAPGAQITKASTILRGLRARKGFDELELMRAAARTVDETIPTAIALCVPGRKESELDERLRKALLAHSPDDSVAFTIIASGENSAYPHHETEQRKLKQGDVVILDYGTKHQGYFSDITVTCSVGEPSDPEVRKVYEVVWGAQQKALEAIRPGVPCEAIDRAAREHIEAAGYGEFFLHRTGHGLGLQVHEPPYMVSGNKELLEEGMTFSVEPGIYLPHRFGVRLEVIAAVGATGVDLINAPSARELPISG